MDNQSGSHSEIEHGDIMDSAIRPHGDSTLGLIVNAIFTTLSFLSVVVALPFFLPLSLVFRLWRHHLDDKVIMESRNAEIIKSDDAIWLQDSSENRAIINSVFELKGRVDVEKFREVVAERFVNITDENGDYIFPKISCYAGWRSGRPIWGKERHFDIKDHVYVWEKSQAPANEQQLHELVGFLSSEALPEHQARWQVILIPYKPDKEVTEENEKHFMLFRVHHTVGDGVSLVKVLMRYLMDTTDSESNIKRFGSKNKMWMIAKAVLTGPSMLMERMYQKSDNNVLHGPVLSGDKIVSWSKCLDLEFIKKMKTVADTTVNDILMSALAGAFTDYFKAHASNVPHSITASVPVDIRSPSSKLVLDNQFAVVFLQLPTDIEDPLERLKETKKRMDNIKISGEPVVNASTMRYSMARLPDWLTRPLLDSITDKCTLVLSNVPGPQQKLSLAGKTIERIVFFPPGRSKVGVSVSILSYCGQVSMGLMVDRCLLTNPDELVDGFCQNLENLAKELNVTEEEGNNMFFVPTNEE